MRLAALPLEGFGVIKIGGLADSTRYGVPEPNVRSVRVMLARSQPTADTTQAAH